MILKVAFCDDERSELDIINKYMESLLKSYPEIIYDVYLSADELLEHYKRAKTEEFYDIIFLDIDIGGLNGVSVAEEIRKADEQALIIYMSKHDQYVWNCFYTKPTDYLVKPVKQEVFNASLISAYKELAARDDVFRFFDDFEYTRLFTDNIIYFDCQGRQSIAHTTEGEYEFTMRKKDVYEQLNKETFVIIHNSYIVNVKYVLRLKFDKAVLQNGEVLPISRLRTQEAKEAFNRFENKLAS